MRPFFPYYGSKWNTARYYPAPKYSPVLEPFAGSAGYALFYDAPVCHLADLDPIIAGVWSYLLRVTPTEILALPELLNAGDSLDDVQGLPQEAEWLIGFWLNRGSAVPKRTRTAYSARTDRAQLTWGSRAKTRIAEQLPGIARWSITDGSYTALSHHGGTWFVDPPYGRQGRYYRKHQVDYDALGTWVQQRPGQVIVCEEAGATWLPFQPLGLFKSTRGRSSEVVFCMESA